MALKNDNHITSVIPETTRQALAAYVLMVRSAGRKKNTVAVYLRCISRLCDYLAAEHYINEMTDVQADHLRGFFLQLQNSHNKGGIEVYYRPIKAWFRWYWDEYEIETRNPISRVKVEHQRVKPRPGIPLDDVERLVDACGTRNKYRDQAVILGLLDTGARASEFCSLRIRDVDFVTGRAYIHAGKGDKARFVRFGNRALRVLRKYLKRRLTLSPSDPLIESDQGGPLDRFSLRLLIDRRAEDAGTKHYGLHDFRRRCAYEMWRRTRDLKAVSAYLGHSSATVTERYLAIDDDDIMDAHEIGSPVDNL